MYATIKKLPILLEPHTSLDNTTTVTSRLRSTVHQCKGCFYLWLSGLCRWAFVLHPLYPQILVFGVLSCLIRLRAIGTFLDSGPRAKSITSWHMQHPAIF